MIGTAIGALKFCEENEAVAHNAKLWIVGARYFHQHEIQYLNELKAYIRNQGLKDQVNIVNTKRNDEEKVP